MCNSQSKLKKIRDYILKSLFSHNACFFYLICNTQFNLSKTNFRVYKYQSHYQARILKVILKVRKLEKVE